MNITTGRLVMRTGRQVTRMNRAMTTEVTEGAEGMAASAAEEIS